MADTQDLKAAAFAQVYAGGQGYEPGVGYTDAAGGGKLHTKQAGTATAGEWEAWAVALSYTAVQGLGIALIEKLRVYLPRNQRSGESYRRMGEAAGAQQMKTYNGLHAGGQRTLARDLVVTRHAVLLQRNYEVRK